MATAYIPPMQAEVSNIVNVDLYAPAMTGIERDASWIEIRLALQEYRGRHGENHWRLYDRATGRA